MLKKAAARLRNQNGGVVVEFGVSLLFLFLFFIAFFQIAMIFLVHERISYAAYIGARVNAVRGNVGRAVSMVRGGVYSVSGESVEVQELMKVPMDFRDIYKRPESSFTVIQKFTIPREKNDTGDNYGSGGSYD